MGIVTSIVQVHCGYLEKIAHLWEPPLVSRFTKESADQIGGVYDEKTVLYLWIRDEIGLSREVYFKLVEVSKEEL
jgi:hypothetical protein